MKATGIAVAVAGTISILFTISTFFTPADAGSLADIKHVVMIMFENRSFDHYFGTMAGVRGFSDPNVQVNPTTGHSTFEQLVDSSLSNKTDILLPYYSAYLGGNWTNAAQCTYGGSNAWKENHAAYNGGLNDHWALNNTPQSMQYHTREIIPVHFAIAEAFTVADMYQQSVMACTNPNRIQWMTGSINVPGGPQSPDNGGTVLQNSDGAPGCASVNPPIDCYPLKWKTVAEYAEDANVTWQVYQDNFDYAGGEDLLTDFQTFQQAKPGNPLYYRGVSFNNNNTLDAFFAQAKNGTLPQVSWLVVEQALSEHPPWMPQNGAWLQRQVVEAVMSGESWKDTVLMISYEEEGGWYDHVTPYHSPQGTPGEWMQDPYGNFGYTFAGPGSRVPFTIISPWTRGGKVFTEHADHTSQILFVEQVLQANGYNFQTEQISAWRREHMSNLVNAFDFENPDFSIPNLPNITTPGKDSSGNYNDITICRADYPQLAPIPYGIQGTNASKVHLLSEQGFKRVRGALTEGRYLTFEFNGYALSALTNQSGSTSELVAGEATTSHNDIRQRWVIHEVEEGGTQFNISSAVDGKWIGQHKHLSSEVSGAATFTIDFTSGQGYTLKRNNSTFLSIERGGVATSPNPVTFDVFSVTYST